LINDALKKLDDAKQMQSEEKYFTAGKYAVEAKALFEKALALLPGIEGNELTLMAFRQSNNRFSAEGIDANALLLAGYGSKSSNLFEFTRQAIVYRIILRDSGKEEYRTLIKLKLKSKAVKTLKNVEVRETIPKTIAENASELISGFTVIEEDPVIGFAIDSIGPGEEKEFSYIITRKLSETELGSFADLQTIIALSDEEKCSVMDFDDNNLCTIDSCELGIVSHAPIADDENCLNGMPRQKAQAAAAGVGPTGFLGLGAGTEQILLGLIIAAVLLGVGFLKRDKLQGFLSRQKAGKKKDRKPAKSLKEIKEEFEEEAEDEGY
jgi:hypothetical protein